MTAAVPRSAVLEFVRSLGYDPSVVVQVVIAPLEVVIALKPQHTNGSTTVETTVRLAVDTRA
jgi:hypothetical protein